jgi:Fibronectin type III domain
VTTPLNSEWSPSRSKHSDGVLAELKRVPLARWCDLLDPSRRFHLIAALAMMLFVALDLRAATYSVRLAWDANPEPDIAGYKVYWGQQSGAPNQSRSVGNVTTATLDNLNEGTTYFFTVTALDDTGLESGPSNEVSHTTPSPPPQVYRLTVVRGSGTGPYPPGTSVQVHAEPPGRGENFAYWDGDTAILQRPRTDKNNEAFTIERNVTISAVYSALPAFTVTVTDGSGDGTFFAGETVRIVADAWCRRSAIYRLERKCRVRGSIIARDDLHDAFR